MLWFPERSNIGAVDISPLCAVGRGKSTLLKFIGLLKASAEFIVGNEPKGDELNCADGSELKVGASDGGAKSEAGLTSLVTAGLISFDNIVGSKNAEDIESESGTGLKS